MRQINILPRAEEDLDEIAAFIAQDNLDAALGLYSAAEAAFLRLAEMPELGVERNYLNPRLSRLRMWPLPHYQNVLVFYEPRDQEVRIVRVLHSARNIAGLFSDFPSLQ